MTQLFLVNSAVRQLLKNGHELIANAVRMRWVDSVFIYANLVPRARSLFGRVLGVEQKETKDNKEAVILNNIGTDDTLWLYSELLIQNIYFSSKIGPTRWIKYSAIFRAHLALLN